MEKTATGQRASRGDQFPFTGPAAPSRRDEGQLFFRVRGGNQVVAEGQTKWGRGTAFGDAGPTYGSGGAKSSGWSTFLWDAAPRCAKGLMGPGRQRAWAALARSSVPANIRSGRGGWGFAGPWTNRGDGRACLFS